MRSRSAFPLLAAVVAAAAMGAAASSLGGLSSAGVGADTAVVGSCSQTGINSHFVVTASNVTAVALNGFPDSCLGQTVYVTVASTAGAEAQASASLSGHTALLSLPHPVAVSDVTSVSLVVAG
jgi:hypothetical protein